MADYAPNFTGRYRVKYSALGRPHSLTVRYADGTTPPAGIITALTAVLTAMTTELPTDFAVIGGEAADKDSDLFLPTSSNPTGTGLGSTSNTGFIPQNCSFVGRAFGGSRVRFHLFGVLFNPLNGATNYSSDYRVMAAESTEVSNAIAALNAATTFVGPDDTPVVSWYPYVNISLNAHWIKKLRG